jgi:cell division protein FtsL
MKHNILVLLANNRVMQQSTNKLYINNMIYKKHMKITRERLFLFALIAATIIAVVVAPFIVGGT